MCAISINVCMEWLLIQEYNVHLLHDMYICSELSKANNGTNENKSLRHQKLQFAFYTAVIETSSILHMLTSLYNYKSLARNQAGYTLQ